MAPRNLRRVSCAALIAGCVIATPFAARAQATEGFSADRFEPSERGSKWFALESLDLRGHLRPAVGLIVDYGYKPLVFYDANGEELSTLVTHQLFAHVGGSLVLWDRLRVGANLPIAVLVGGSSGSTSSSSFSTEEGTNVGDARLGADVRLFGEYGGLITGAAGLQLHLPTGSRGAFTGDGNVRVTPHAMVAGTAGQLAYAARLGFTYRGLQQSYDGAAVGSEFTWGASVGVILVDGRLLVGPELYGATGVTEADAVFGERTTPMEVAVGGHYDVTPEWRAGLGVGPGLFHGLGTPQVRVLASVEWVPGTEKKVERPADGDGDGITDHDDACPSVKGVASDDRSRHGCPAAAPPPPPPPDSDADGILDEVDACPDEKGVASDDPKTNGCPPPPDRDGDGILDIADACPDEKGVATGDPKTHGCPPPKDTDSDSIVDPEDACPETAGPKNDDPKKNGCPAARVEQGQIRIIEQVQFGTGSDRILKVSDPVLEAVLKVLLDHPEITELSVEGHTDNRGNAASNKGLSQRRAASVVKWLVAHSIDKKRLTSAGFGQEKPLAGNDTDEGRQTNRRVEFHIRKVDGKDAE